MPGSDSIEREALELVERAIELPSSERAAWVSAQAVSDPAVKKRAISILTADISDGTALRTGGAPHDAEELPPPARAGAYEIKDLIGRGGMGAVYLGERDTGDFDHRVAIKIIRPAILKDQLVERFERERQILARLNHPNIARLLDGGVLDDGSPYFVMEYVEGEPIATWANEKGLSVSDRLWLFADICSAVRHAHQNLIIHRDITPSNVLVTKDGLVKLIDFGIAKPQSFEDLKLSEPSVNAAGSLNSLSFTPGFAAPERAAGAPANTLSDIYSLGMLLRDLLGGVGPNREISAIISKATRQVPGERYLSVDALLDDIQRHETDRTVSALEGGAVYRLRKLFKRRRYVTMSAGLAVAGIVGALVVTTTLYQQARAAEAQASQRFVETRELTGFLLNELATELNGIPGAMAAEEKVTETTTKYLNLLAEAADQDDSVKLEYATALWRLGSSKTQAGGANMGDASTGIDFMEKSVRVLTELELSDPDNADVLFAMGDVLSDLGYAKVYHSGDYKTGPPDVQRSLEAYDRGLAINPDDLAASVNSTSARLVSLYLRDPTYDSAVAQLSDIEQRWEELLVRFPDNSKVKSRHIAFQRVSANYALDYWSEETDETVPVENKKEFEIAKDRIRRSVNQARKVLLEDPGNQENIYQLVWSAEIEAHILGLDKAWEPTTRGIIEELTALSSRPNASDLAADYLQDRKFDDRKALGRYALSLLDETDQLLTNRLAPFEKDNFTFVEAVYYNEKARANTEAKLMFNFEASGQAYQKALQIAADRAASFPDERLWPLEQVATLAEWSYLELVRTQISGSASTETACPIVKRAKNKWQDIQSMGFETDDYKPYYNWVLEIEGEANCRE